MNAGNRIRVALLCMAVMWWGGAGAAEPVPSAGECFAAGFEANNADTVAQCYAEDAIMWFPGGTMAKGRVAIRDGFAHFLAGFTVKDVELATIGQETLGDTRIA